MVKPTFICIGVQKAGTTSLIYHLNQHPDVFMANGEPHFFDTTIPTTSAITAYEQQFITTKSIVGEKTPSYNYLRYAIDRIFNYNPNMKLVLILREPVSRAFSQYNMFLNKKNKTLNEKQVLLDFKKEQDTPLSTLTKNGQYYIIRGKYDEIISYILTKFSRDNLYIGIAEEIKANKHKYYNEIFKFLGAAEISAINESANDQTPYKTPIPRRLEKMLYHIYKPHNERLYTLLGRKIDIWEEYYKGIELPR